MLEVQNASARYPGGPWLFRNLTLSLVDGEICAVLGPNGTGKTTLLKAILGIAPIVSGNIERPARIGHVPQSLEVLFSFSVLDMVLMGRAAGVGLFAAPSRADRAAAEAALRDVGMESFRDRRFSSLSGGERQLVLLARAIAGEAELILLDEATAALDLANEEKVLCVLEYLKERGATILMTTHDPEHALRLADKALMMFAGGDFRFGAVSEVLTDANLTELYGVPLRRIEVDTPAGARAVIAKLPGVSLKPATGERA